MSALIAKTIRFADFELDGPKRLLRKQGKAVSLNSKAFDLLAALVERHGEVVTKDELLETVWPGQIVEEGNLTVQISTLRKIFGERKDEHRFIVTVPGRGYSFVAEIEPEPDGAMTPRDSPIAVDDDQAIGDDASPANESNATDDSRSRLFGRGPVAVVAVVAVGILILAAGLAYRYFPRGTANPAPIESIAVMPFVNESGNPDIEYLSDGMAETLINSLSQLPTLSVKARTSAFLYKGKTAAAKEIGADLDVQAVLFGRFIQRGDDLTLYLSLVDTRSENQIWGKQYVRKLNNLLAVQSEIAQDVSENLRSKLSGAERQRVAKKHTENIEAYNLYLHGRFYWNQFTGDSITTAIRYFEQAIEKDENYALAYTGLATSYIVLGVNGHMPVADARPKSKIAVESALALDDQLAEAHLSLGAHRLFFDWDFEGAEREFRRAMELDPGYAQPHELYSYVLRSQGRFDEAIAAAKKAHELDPLDLIIYIDIGSASRLAGRSSDAVEVFRKIIEIDPNLAEAHFENGLANSVLQNHETAEDEMKRGVVLSDHSTHIKAGLGIVYARAGKTANAQRVIDELTRETGEHYVSPLDIAQIYSLMGEREKAFEWLEKAFTERAPWLIEIKVNQDWEPIRDDTRYQDLLRKMNL